MVYAETLKICRLCLSDGQSLINLFRRNGRTCEEVKLISDLLQFEVSYKDGYPHFVCCTCLEKLSNFNNFKNDCTNYKKTFDKNYACLKECRITLTQMETVEAVKQEIEEEIEVTVRSEDGMELLEDPLRLTIPLDNQDGMGMVEDPLQVTTPYDNQSQSGLLDISKQESEEDEETSSSEDDIDIHEDPLEVTTPYDNKDEMDIFEDPLKVTTPYDNQDDMEILEDPLQVTTPYDNQDGMGMVEDPLQVTTPYDNQSQSEPLDMSNQESEEDEETSRSEMETVEAVKQEREEEIEVTMEIVEAFKQEIEEEIKVTVKSKDSVSSSCRGLIASSSSASISSTYGDQSAPRSLKLCPPPPSSQEAINLERSYQICQVAIQKSLKRDQFNRSVARRLKSRPAPPISSPSISKEAINLERSYEICQAAIQKLPKCEQLKHKLKPPPVSLPLSILGAPESIKGDSSGSSSSTVPSINSNDEKKAGQYVAETSNEKTGNKKTGSTASASILALKPLSSQPAIAAIIYKNPPVLGQSILKKTPTARTPLTVSIATRHQAMHAVTPDIQRPRVIENSQEKKTEGKDDLKRTEDKDDLKKTEDKDDLKKTEDKDDLKKTADKDDLSESTKETNKGELSTTDIDDDDTSSDKDYTPEESDSNTESQSSSSDEETEGSSQMEKKTIIECKSSKSPKPGYSTSKREIAPSDKEELQNLKMSKSKAMKIMQARIDKIFSHAHTVTRRTSFFCDECDKTFPKTRLLADHKKEHGRDIPFQCITCLRPFKEYYRWFEHLKIHSKGKAKKQETRAETGDQQRIIVLNKWFQCDKCRKSFDNSRSFDRHMKKHEKGSLYICLVCGKEFMAFLIWKAHIKCHGEKEFGCRKCPKRFYTQHCLNLHLKTHSGLKPFQCKVCNKSYTRETTLNNHMVTHENIVPYECDICHKTFNFKQQVRMHMLLHTNPEKLTCEECGKLCRNIYYLKVHKQTHSSTPGFLCNKCGKTFSSINKLKTHLIVHSGKKPFACDMCDKAFNRKSNLDLHKSVHSENKAFMCDKCGKCFSRKVYLKYHKRIHERDNEKVRL